MKHTVAHTLLTQYEENFCNIHKGLFFYIRSGKKFYPLDCRPEDIDIQDIAHALSHICRYGGHSKWFYSVAQHSFLVSQMVDSHHALWGLLHDAAEAYVGDIIHPIKINLPEFALFEKKVFNSIKTRFKLKGEIPPAVKLADSQILHAEAKAVLGINLAEPGWTAPPSSLPTIEEWTLQESRERFLARFEELVNREVAGF